MTKRNGSKVVKRSQLAQHRSPARPSEPVRPENWLILADIAEFLDYPRESLVVVAVNDDPRASMDPWPIRTFPLPHDDGALSCQVLAMMVAAEMRATGMVSRTMLITFSSAAPVRPLGSLQFAISNRLHEDDIHSLGSFYVSGAGWGSYYCDEPECLGPLPLSELAEGAASLADPGS